MGDWQTYRLEDFIPFTSEVYYRLIERVNEAFWPLHFVAIILGLAALILAWRGRSKIALALLAPAWIFSGIVFHLNYYAEINWAAPWFGWAFLTQAALLLLIAAFRHRQKNPQPAAMVIRLTGAAIAALALVAYPLVAVFHNQGWSQSQSFALHPDPTAVATLGIVLVVLPGGRAWLGLLIPALWCVTTILTLIALGTGWPALPAIIAILTGLALLLAGIGHMHRRSRAHCRTPADPRPD